MTTTTNYPTNLDTFPDLTVLTGARLDGSDGYSHVQEHDRLGDAVAALEAKVGITNSADTASLDYKINHIDLSGLGLGTASTHAATDFLATANNLSDVVAATARTNLGLGTAATQGVGTFVQVANNLSDVVAATARTNLGLGTAATQSTGTFAQVANNLSDVTAATARTNLGLGTAATQASTAFAQLAGVSGGQILDGGTANTDTLTFLATAHATPATGSDIIFKSGTTQLLKLRKSGWTYHGPVASGFPQYEVQAPGIEFNNDSVGAVYSSASGLGASFVGTEASAFGATVNMRNSAGTVASPTPLQSGAVIGGLRVGSLLAAGSGVDCGQMYFRTTQIHTASHTGTDIAFYTCANDTTTKRVVATMGNDGTFTTLAGITAPNMIDTTSAGSSTVNVATAAFGVGVRRYGASMSLNLARVNGSTGSPTALANNNDIGQFASFGAFDTSGDVQQGATMKMTATQAWTSTNNGSQINLSTVPNNSVVQTSALILGQDQSATFAGAVSGVTTLSMAGTLTGATNMWNLSSVSSSTVNVQTASLGALGLRSYAANNVLALYRLNGSVGSPTALASGDTIGGLQFGGAFDTSNSVQGQPLVQAKTTQTWTSSANGTKLVFNTIANGGTGATAALTLDQNQSATFAGAVSGVSTLAIGGALSGVTTLAMNGALSGATTIAGAGTLSGMTNVAYLDGSGSATYGNVITAGFGSFLLTGVGASCTLNLGRTNGSVGSPTAITSGQSPALINFQGQYDTTAGDTGSGARISATSTEAYAGAAGTPSALGTKLVFSTVPNTTTSLTTALTLDQDQSATFAGNVLSQKAQVRTPTTVTVTSNAGTVPVTCNNAKFTNSSASAMTVTMATSGAADGQITDVRIFDASAAVKAITWVNTESGYNGAADIVVPANSKGVTTIPTYARFMFNSATTKWTCIGL